MAERLEAVVRRLNQSQDPPRVAVRIGSSTLFFDPREITRFRASNKYVVFQLGRQEYLLDESIDSTPFARRSGFPHGRHPSQSLIVVEGCRDVTVKAINASKKTQIFGLERYAFAEPLSEIP